MSTWAKEVGGYVTSCVALCVWWPGAALIRVKSSGGDPLLLPRPAALAV
jgi:hypothetical protein